MLGVLVLAGCVQVPAPLAAPGVQILELALAPAGFVAAGQVVGATARLANPGPDAVKPEAALILDGAQIVPARALQLWPGREESVSFYFTAPADGAHEVTFELSSGEARTAALLVGTPRVRIDALSALPDPALVGEPVTFFLQLGNGGTAPGSVGLQLQADGRELASEAIDDVMPGDPRTWSVTRILERPGVVRIVALLSNGDDAELSLVVTAPELRVQGWGHEEDGCGVRLTLTVRNAGDGAARDATLAFQLVDAGGRAGPTLRRDLGEVPAGGSEDVAVVLERPAPCHAGNPYQVQVRGAARHADGLAWDSPWIAA